MRNDAVASRYERDVDGDVAFTHTIVPEAAQGGVASRLIGAALADVRTRGLRIVPRRSFVARTVETHPETRDLIADA